MSIFLEYDYLRKVLEENEVTAVDVQAAQALVTALGRDKDRVLYAQIKRAFEASNDEQQNTDAEVIEEVTQQQVDDAANKVKMSASAANRVAYAQLKRQRNAFLEQQQKGAN